MQQMVGKIPASEAATHIADAKKRRGKRTRSTVSADTTMISSDVQTIDDDDDEGDLQSPKATTARRQRGQAVETPRSALETRGGLHRAPAQ
jgi:hypothetical protein